MADRLAIIHPDSIKELKAIKDELKQIVPLFKEVSKEAQKVNRALNAAKPKEYADAMKNLKDVTAQYVNIEKKLADSMMRLAKLETQQAQAAYENARARRENAAASREESRARQQVTKEARDETRNNESSTSAWKRLTKEVRDARQKARDYGAEIIVLKQKYKEGQVSSKDFNTQLNALKKNFSLSTKEAIKLEKELKKLNQSTLPSGQRNGALQGRVTDIIKGIGIFSLAEKGLSSLTNAASKLGVEFYNTAVKLETLRFAQKAVFKTNDEVKNQNIFLTEIASKYGLEILALTDAYTKFSASAQGTTLEGEKSKQIFDAVTKSSAMLGVTTDDTNGILRALGQMMSKGKVQAEELRGQLGDRMAGAFRLFADGMGVSTAQLDKMLKDGKVITEDVLPKFADQLNKKYQLGFGEEIDTKQASLARLKNEWVDFVDAVESRTGIVSMGIGAVSNAIITLLQALKPSKEITVIEQQQQKLNELAIELRKTWNDENKRKEVLNDIIELNPMLLRGMDLEKTSLEEITKRLQEANVQYYQRIILQEQQEKISELVKDQAENYKELAKILSENAVEYNSFSKEVKNAIDSFSSGAIDYKSAEVQIISATRAGSEERRKAISILKDMNSVYAKGKLDGFNYVRGINDGNAAIKEATGEYNNLLDVTNRWITQQGQMISFNGLLAKSYKSTGDAVINRRKQIEEELKIAEGMGKNIALVSNVWREKVNGKWTTTNKKQTEGWYEENGKIVKRKPATLPEKEEKPKAASLTAAQKDFINEAMGIRDKEIAIQKQKFLDLEINEEEYWKRYESIVQTYSNKIQNYLKGKNAKEIQVEGATFKKAIDAREQASKELYDIRSKKLEENGKKEMNILERASNQLEENDYLTNQEKLLKQIDLDSQMISQLNSNYEEQIKLAEKSAQSTIEIERKRDEEIGKIQDERSKKVKSLPEAFNQDVDRTAQLAGDLQNKNYEEQKLEILKKRIPLKDKEYLLSHLDLENEKQSLLNERNTLELKKAELDTLALIVPLTKEQKDQYSAIETQIASINSQLETTIQNQDLLTFHKLSEGLQPIVDFVANGLNDLGLDHISNQFTKMYQKILDEGKNFSMSSKEIFESATAVIADFAQQFNEAQKNSTISALDEQLKYTEETTNQELDFINQRLERLNALDELNAEQIAERNALEDEARTIKEQQAQREKMIEAQKARAEQKAAAQQALINGALAATMTLAQMGFIAGAVPAALALGFGIAQSIAIMSKDPVPKYRVGRSGGKAEYAITQDGGREMITDKKGNIKSLGSDKGDQLTWLDEGDKVHTASETQSILSRMQSVPKLGDNLFQRLALKSLIAPQLIVSKNEIDYDKLADKIGSKFENSFKRYTHPTTERVNGKIIRHRGANLGEIIGYYDPETGKEINNYDTN